MFYFCFIENPIKQIDRIIRKGIFLVSGVLLASMCAGGCSQSQKQASATDEEQALFACTDSITTVCDSILTQIRDNAQERLMQLSLFGELPQALIDSLGISQGVPASVSTFLLEIDGKRILFDTGMGAPDSRLLTNLSAVGVTPADIDYQVGKFIIVGDLVHGASLQLAHPEICAAYDMDPQAAVQKRRHFLDYARQNHLFLAGMHQPAGHAK